jgi:hypothetical protein
VIDDRFERARLGEQMSGAGDDLQCLSAAKACECLLVELDDAEVGAAHDQQGGNADVIEDVAGKVRAAAARDNRLDPSPNRAAPQALPLLPYWLQTGRMEAVRSSAPGRAM